jgi:hypothetical protein
MHERLDQERDEETLELDTAHQVFNNSPTLLALCLTVIGIIKIYTTLQKVTTIMDNCLAFAVVAFLIATVLSYLAIRASTRKSRLKLGRIADMVFLWGARLHGCGGPHDHLRSCWLEGRPLIPFSPKNRSSRATIVPNYHQFSANELELECNFCSLVRSLRWQTV